MQRAAGRLCRKFVLANHFRGEPKYEDIKLIEQNLPAIKDGGKKKLRFFGSDCQYVFIYFKQSSCAVPASSVLIRI